MHRAFRMRWGMLPDGLYRDNAELNGKMTDSLSMIALLRHRGANENNTRDDDGLQKPAQHVTRPSESHPP